MQTDVSLPELRNAASRRSGFHVPNAANAIPTISSGGSLNTRINIRGEIQAAKPSSPGLFGDGAIGATAIESGSTLVTDDKLLRNAVNARGGTAVGSIDDLP